MEGVAGARIRRFRLSGSETTRVLSRITVLALAATLAACGAGANGSVDGAATPELSDYQRAVLEDGEVTYAEYEAAILAAMACLEERGVPTTGPIPEQGGRFLGFDYGFLPLNASPSESRRVEEAFAECEREYISGVTEAYAQANAWTEAELADYESLLLACIQEHGYGVDPAAGSEAVYAAIAQNFDELGPCLDRYP